MLWTVRITFYSLKSDILKILFMFKNTFKVIEAAAYKWIVRNLTYFKKNNIVLSGIFHKNKL